jgi:hypothetical protein
MLSKFPKSDSCQTGWQISQINQFFEKLHYLFNFCIYLASYRTKDDFTFFRKMFTQLETKFVDLLPKFSRETISIVFPMMNLMKTFTTERIKQTQLFFMGTNNVFSYSIDVNISLESLSTSDLVELFDTINLSDHGKVNLSNKKMNDDSSKTPVLSEI